MSTLTIPAPRPSTPTGPVRGDLPHVEVIDGRLCVVFPPSCTWPQERMDAFAEALRVESERLVRERQLRKAAERGLI